VCSYGIIEEYLVKLQADLATGPHI